MWSGRRLGIEVWLRDADLTRFPFSASLRGQRPDEACQNPRKLGQSPSRPVGDKSELELRGLPDDLGKHHYQGLKKQRSLAVLETQLCISQPVAKTLPKKGGKFPPVIVIRYGAGYPEAVAVGN